MKNCRKKRANTCSKDMPKEIELLATRSFVSGVPASPSA